MYSVTLALCHSSPGCSNATSLILVKEDLEDVGLLLLEDHLPLLHVPVEHVAGLRGDSDAAVLGDKGVRDDRSKCRVCQCVLQLKRDIVSYKSISKRLWKKGPSFKYLR